MAAFDATPEEHAAGILRQRNPGPLALGSRFLTELTWGELAAAPWEPYQHDGVAPGCEALRAPIPGFLGVMHLDELPAGASLRLVDGHATGFVEAVYDAPGGVLVPIDYTTAIMGMDDGIIKIFTVFPGPPVQPSSLPTVKYEGRVVSVEEARELGFRHVKIGSNLAGEAPSSAPSSSRAG